jgi:hypothetical protein
MTTLREIKSGSFSSVVIGTLNYPLNNNLLSIFEPHGKTESGKLILDIPFKVTFAHMRIVCTVLEGGKIMPLDGTTSHFDVYGGARLSNFLNISQEKFADAFGNWTKTKEWIKLENPEYLLLLQRECEELVDFPRYFREHPEPYACIPNAVTPYKDDPVGLVDYLGFMQNFPLEQCYEGNNPDIKANVKVLRNARAAAWKYFLVEPHNPLLADYFKYSPDGSTADCWSCEKVANIDRPVPGEATLVDMETFTRRFDDFTHYQLKKSPNPKVERPFPFDRVAISGGGITRLLDPSYKASKAMASDVDLFIVGNTPEERRRTFDEIVDWFSTWDAEKQISTTFFAMRGSVCTVYLTGIRRQFQIITINQSNPWEILYRFDLSHSKWCLWNGKIYGLPESCRALRTRTTRFFNTKRLQIARLLKALQMGYNIEKSPKVAEIAVDLDALLNDPVNRITLEKELRKLSEFYCPEGYTEMEPKDRYTHYTAMVARQSKTDVVTGDPKFVKDNIVIDGNFEKSYGIVPYSMFNENTVQNELQPGGRTHDVLIINAVTVPKFATPEFTIVKRTTGANMLEFTVKVAGSEERQFREFCTLLEERVFPRFRPGQRVAKKIINDAGECTFAIEMQHVHRQRDIGKALLRDQSGQPLNLEEDLHVGDTVQIVFVIKMRLSNDRAVELVFFTAIKHVEKKSLKQIEAAPKEVIAPIVTDTLEYVD